MKKISAIIVVKNKPPHLLESIHSIADFVNEIIIGNIQIDEDYRKELSLNEKIKIIDLPADIPFADLIKEDLKKKADGDYILYLDPDEIFPSNLKSDLLKLQSKFDYFYFPRKNIIFNKWIKHSRWWPDYQLRFFKKNAVVWPKKLHPQPQARGKGYHFSAEEKYAILHYNYENLDQYFEKALRYAKAEADTLLKNRQDYSLSTALRQATSEFVSRFFAFEGFKDGMHGLVLAFLQMFYYFFVYFYFWEKKKYLKVEQDQLIKVATDHFKHSLTEVNHWLIKKNLITSLKQLKIRIQNLFTKLLS